MLPTDKRRRKSEDLWEKEEKVVTDQGVFVDYASLVYEDIDLLCGPNFFFFPKNNISKSTEIKSN